MKKLTAIILVAAAAAAMSCSKTEPLNKVDGETIRMNVNVSMPETKVIFGNKVGDVYQLKWNLSGESLRIYERKDAASWSSKIVTDSYTASSDRLTASFTATIPVASASTYDYYLAYPGGSNNFQIGSGDSSNYLKIIRMGTKVSPQVPTAASADARYVFLIAKQEGLTSQPTELNAAFTSISSFGKMTVTGLGATTVSKITITFNDKQYVTGFIDYRVDTDAVALTKSNSLSKNYIEIDPKNLSINSTGFDVWFGIPVQTIAAGESITFTFTTPNGDLVKTVTVPAGKSLNFQRGHTVGFTVDMSGISTDTPTTKTLTFDFIETDTAKLPTSASTNLSAEMKNFTWPADDGNSYQFYNAGYFYHSTSATNAMLSAGSATSVFSYLGLPAIPGYKLVNVALQRAYSSERHWEITSACPIGTTTSLTGDLAITTATPSIDLTGKTDAGTMYYIHAIVCSNNYLDIKKIILTYDPA